MSVVSYQLEGEIGVIRLNNPPVNALSHVLRTGTQDAVTQAQDDASLVLVLMCEGLWLSKGGNTNILNSCHLPRASPPALGWGGVLQHTSCAHGMCWLGMW
jgi:3-hydroxyacyl-CoA dehydrogenase